jgi:hypothetical protein
MSTPDKKKAKSAATGVFESVEGLTPVDPEALEAFKRAMDKAIPEIAEQEDERRALAAESRRWPLKS